MAVGLIVPVLTTGYRSQCLGGFAKAEIILLNKYVEPRPSTPLFEGQPACKDWFKFARDAA